MTDKMKNLLVRTASGAVMLVVVLGAMLLSKWSCMALMTAIALGGMWEFYHFAERAGYKPMRILGLFAGVMTICIGVAVVMLVSRECENLATVILLMSLFCSIMIVPLMFICELYRKSATPIANIGTTILGAIYVALPMSLLLILPTLLGRGEWNPWIIMFHIFIIWANDVFAYLFGITFGRHRLFERISPKKSWEGFFGGVLGAMAMGYVAAIVMEMSAPMWIGLALVAAISGVFGDLVESLMKRSVDVKDSGNIIPGHGGWLDRFDALILSAPFVFLYACVYTIVF